MILRNLFLILGCSSSLMAAPMLSDGMKVQQESFSQNGSSSLETTTNGCFDNTILEAKHHSHSSHHDKCNDKRGPTGATGPTGPTGPTGATGATGVVAQSYGGLYASSAIQGDTITIVTPIGSLPPTNWQPLPTDTFSPSLGMQSITPTNASITIGQSGIYLINSSLTIRQLDSSAAGGICGIGYTINGIFQPTNMAAITIDTATLGPLYSCSFSGLIHLTAGDVVEFTLAGNSTISEHIQLVTADANLVQVGN